MANYITRHSTTVKNWQLQKTAGNSLNKIHFTYREKYSLLELCPVRIRIPWAWI